MHPLIDLRKLTDDQLQQKIIDLNKRLLQAFKMGGQTGNQIRIILETYRTELTSRTVDKQLLEDPENKPGVILDTDDTEPKTKDELDELIDIDKF